MVEYKKVVIGTLALLLSFSILYISMGGVKLRVDEDRSTFYVQNENNRWIVAGREYNKIFEGTSQKYRDVSEIKVESFIDEEAEIVRFVRTTPYKVGATIVDTYTFSGKTDDVKLFPIEHKVEIFNGTGLFYRYEVRDLNYSGLSYKLQSETELEFGLNMNLELAPNYRWAWVYKDGIVKAQYDIDSDYEVFYVRLFDPPGQDLTIDGTTSTLDGFLEYDNVYVINGGTLSATAGSWLNISVNDTFYVDSTSTIDLDKKGLAGGSGGICTGSEGAGGTRPAGFGGEPNGNNGGVAANNGGGGGSGAGHGGAGGAGRGESAASDGIGGIARGLNSNYTLLMGGGAGGGGAYYRGSAPYCNSGSGGERGGGALTINATIIKIYGEITADGGIGGSSGAYRADACVGIYIDGGSGGGSTGGGVNLIGRRIDIAGSTITAIGGIGGTSCFSNTPTQGYSGNGGRIKIFYLYLNETGTTYSYSGGTLYKEKIADFYFPIISYQSTNNTIPINGTVINLKFKTDDIEENLKNGNGTFEIKAQSNATKFNLTLTNFVNDRIEWVNMTWNVNYTGEIWACPWAMDNLTNFNYFTTCTRFVGLPFATTVIDEGSSTPDNWVESHELYAQWQYTENSTNIDTADIANAEFGSVNYSMAWDSGDSRWETTIPASSRNAGNYTWTPYFEKTNYVTGIGSVNNFIITHTFNNSAYSPAIPAGTNNINLSIDFYGGATTTFIFEQNSTGSWINLTAYEHSDNTYWIDLDSGNTTENTTFYWFTWADVDGVLYSSDTNNSVFVYKQAIVKAYADSVNSNRTYDSGDSEDINLMCWTNQATLNMNASFTNASNPATGGWGINFTNGLGIVTNLTRSVWLDDGYYNFTCKGHDVRPIKGTSDTITLRVFNGTSNLTTWNGSTWSETSGFEMPATSYKQQDLEPTNQNSTQGIIRVCNTNSNSTTPREPVEDVYVYLNETPHACLTIYADTDSGVWDGVDLSSNEQLFISSLEQGSCQDVWIAANLSYCPQLDTYYDFDYKHYSRGYIEWQ